MLLVLSLRFIFHSLSFANISEEHQNLKTWLSKTLKKLYLT